MCIIAVKFLSHKPAAEVITQSLYVKKILWVALDYKNYLHKIYNIVAHFSFFSLVSLFFPITIRKEKYTTHFATSETLLPLWHEGSDATRRQTARKWSTLSAA